MLERLSPAFPRPLPDGGIVARVVTDDALSAWRGMGYYRRAGTCGARRSWSALREARQGFARDSRASRRLAGVRSVTAGLRSRSMAFGDAAARSWATALLRVLLHRGRDASPADTGCFRTRAMWQNAARHDRQRPTRRLQRTLRVENSWPTDVPAAATKRSAMSARWPELDAEDAYGKSRQSKI